MATHDSQEAGLAARANWVGAFKQKGWSKPTSYSRVELVRQQ